jgi:hypothetical protein
MHRHTALTPLLAALSRQCGGGPLGGVPCGANRGDEASHAKQAYGAVGVPNDAEEAATAAAIQIIPDGTERKLLAEPAIRPGLENLATAGAVGHPAVPELALNLKAPIAREHAPGERWAPYLFVSIHVSSRSTWWAHLHLQSARQVPEAGASRSR